MIKRKINLFINCRSPGKASNIDETMKPVIDTKVNDIERDDFKDRMTTTNGKSLY